MFESKSSSQTSAWQIILAIVLVQLTGLASLGYGESRPLSVQEPVTLQATPVARLPFPQHVTYAPGVIHPNHISRHEQDQIVGRIYERWKQKYITPIQKGNSGGEMYRINGGRHNRGQTYSEGQGYGMIIVAIMAGYDPEAKAIFDGLWNFTRSHPSRIDKRLMAYKVPAMYDQRNSAFDGDCDIAYGLLLAHRQWGSTGMIDYRAEATEVIEGLSASVIGPESHLPMLGDWVNPNGPKYHQRTLRSSDFIAGHFRAFAHATGKKVWLEVVHQCQNVMNQLLLTTTPETGLVPDFIVTQTETNPRYRPAPEYFLEGHWDGSYYFNAARVPWRIGTDAILNNDPVSLAQVRKMASWIVGATRGAPARINPGYYLNGHPLPGKGYLSKAFVAPFGVAVMVMPSQQDYLNQVFDLIKDNPQDYYEDTLGLLCMLVMTGNFWDPTLREDLSY